MTSTARGHQAGRPFVIGVTGNIACGKSLVLGMLTDVGAATIDADHVYHRLIQPRLPLWHSLVERFGRGILDSAGRIDRRVLGRLVFSDPSALADLDRITHPAVIAEIERMIAAELAAIVAIDAVKLIESGLDAACDRVWLVTCRPEQQVDRLIRRNGLPRDEAERRVAAQPPSEPKLSRADVIIDNSGSIEATRRRVMRACEALPIG